MKRYLPILALLCAGCGTSVPRFTPGSAPERTPDNGQNLFGTASFYASEFDGRTTANGETYDMHALTAAHRTLPFDTRVRVRNLGNNRTVVVRINDRGPFKAGRVIDLSLEAARQLGMVEQGTATVELIVLSSP